MNQDQNEYSQENFKTTTGQELTVILTHHNKPVFYGIQKIKGLSKCSDLAVFVYSRD